jgi:F-type H+-transporting ATPase subunit b
MLDFQLSTFIFQIVNFFLLLAALTWFLFRPLLRVMKKREAEIAAQINGAIEKAQNADQERQNLAAEIQRARQRSDTLLSEARVEADHARVQVLEQARAEASQLFEDARRRIVEQERSAEQRLQGRIVQTTVGMAGGLIRQSAGPDIHNALLEAWESNGTGLGAGQLEMLQRAMNHGDPPIQVELAYPPTPEVERRIRATLAGQLGRDADSLVMSFKVEPSLIAGTRILVGTVALDLSLSRTLSELAQNPVSSPQG